MLAKEMVEVDRWPRCVIVKLGSWHLHVALQRSDFRQQLQPMPASPTVIRSLLVLFSPQNLRSMTKLLMTPNLQGVRRSFDGYEKIAL